MTVSTQQQTIIKKPSWWKQRSALKRGLVVIVLSAILLCIALTIAIVVIVFISGSCHTGDCAAGTSEPEMLPVKAEALFLRHFWLKRHKTIRIATRTSDERLATNSPVRNRTPTSVERLATTSPVRNRSPTNKPKRGVCDTDECRLDASIISKKMDSTVDPCDNFYRYVCGGFIKSTRIPKYEKEVDSKTANRHETTKRLRTIFEAKSEPNEGKPFRLVKSLYKSCMNTSAIEADGLQSLRTILRGFGGWPVLDGASWNDSDFDIVRSIYQIRNAGYSVDYFIKLEVTTAIEDSTQRVILIGDADLAVEAEYLLKGFGDKNAVTHYDYMVEIASILGAERDSAKAELKKSLDFEMKLAKAGSVPISKEYVDLTVTELKKRFSTVPWKEYFNRLLPSTMIVDEEQRVRVRAPERLEELERLISKTPKRVQANYVMCRVAAASAYYLSEPIRKKKLKELAAKSERNVPKARWEECVDIVSASLPIIVNAMYVKIYYNKDVKEAAVEIAMNIREEMRKNLETCDWLDEKTRQAALEKAEAMTSVIGYHDELLDENKIEEFYKYLELSEDNLFKNIFNLKRFDTDMPLEKLRVPVKNTDVLKKQIETTLKDKIYYLPAANTINVLAGASQGDFFRSGRPKYMNYGAIGMVIGHEMTHGFGSNGREYDKNGEIANWWTSSSDYQFLKRAECLIDQYDSYTIQEIGLNVDGSLTLGENIADNGGIKLAYRAYNGWVARNGEEKQLPGFSWTPKQLFWISYANARCRVITPEHLKNLTITDPHAPREFRVVGPLSNMPEFAVDFKCPEGSKMNPKNKCSVW